MKVAYQVNSDNESQIIFTKYSEKFLLDEHEEVVRKPEYDQYLNLGYVPKEILQKDGWWFECDQCYRKIESDGWDYENDVELDVIYQDNLIFCCPDCQEGHKNEQIRKLTERTKWLNYVEAHYPGAKITGLLVGLSETYISLKLPNCKYKANWYSSKPNEISFSEADGLPAKIYFDSLTKVAIAGT